MTDVADNESPSDDEMHERIALTLEVAMSGAAKVVSRGKLGWFAASEQEIIAMAMIIHYYFNEGVLFKGHDDEGRGDDPRNAQDG